MSRLISVRTDVVLDLMVEGIVEAAAARAPSAPPLDEALAVTLGATAADPARAALGARLARAGWAAREVELERFEPARAPVVGVTAETCAALAAAEPLGLPRPDDPDAVTWRVPGPGGHVRHHVAMRALAGAGPPELKRCWVYGFLRRCCA